MLGDHEVFEHGHAGEQADVLEGARHLGMLRDAEIVHALEQEFAAVRMAQHDHALGRLVEAGDAVEDRGLAGAVGADERGDVVARRQ